MSDNTEALRRLGAPMKPCVICGAATIVRAPDHETMHVCSSECLAQFASDVAARTKAKRGLSLCHVCGRLGEQGIASPVDVAGKVNGIPLFVALCHRRECHREFDRKHPQHVLQTLTTAGSELVMNVLKIPSKNST